MYTKNKRDTNEAEIIDALRAAGASVKQMDRLAGFDLLVAYGDLYVMEVKSDIKESLTQAEQLYQRELDWAGVTYHVVYTAEQALQILGLVEEAQHET